MSNERSLKVARNARAWMFKNVAGVIVSFATVPLALRALGTESYGVFQVLVSLASLVAISDVGLGTALFTRVGHLAGSNKQAEIAHLVGGALMVISAVVLVVTTLSLAALSLVDVPAFLKTPPRLWAQAQRGLYLVLLAFAVRMPLSVFSSAHGGLQIGDRLVGWNVGGAFGASVAMIVAATVTHRLDWALGCQLAVSVLSTIGAVRLGLRLEPVTKPAFRRQDIAAGWALLRSGIFYYLFQVEVTVIASLDNIVIARVIGVEVVALYSVASRVIGLAFSMVYSFGGSFWPAVANAVGHGDIAWIRAEGARLRRLGTLWMAIFAGGLTAVGVPVISLWTGNRLHVDPMLLATLGAYYVIVAHTMIDTSILSGAEKIRQQIAIMGLEAGLNLALSIWLARRLGYVGVGLGTLIAHLVCSVFPLQYYSWKLVAVGPRPSFWPPALTAAVVSVAAGLAIHRALGHLRPSGPVVAVAAGGLASLLATLAAIRLFVGSEGIEVLRGIFRKDRVA